MPYKFNPFTGTLDYYETGSGGTGPTGPAGANGKDGVNGIDGTDGEDGWIIPGPAGAAGTGAAGAAGIPIVLPPEDVEEPLHIPGPQGPTGANGTNGTNGVTTTNTTVAFISIEPDVPEDPISIPGATGPQGPAGSSGGGSATVTAVIITVPYGSLEYIATVTDASATAASKIMLSPGDYADTDANEMAAETIAYNTREKAAGSFKIKVASMDRTFIGGTFKFNYILG